MSDKKKPKLVEASADVFKKLQHSTRVFTLKDLSDLLPQDYTTPTDDYHLLGWAFAMPNTGNVSQITVKVLRGRYVVGQNGAVPTLDLQQVDLPGAVIRPYNVRQRRVPVDCGVPYGKSTSPAAEVKSEVANGPFNLPPEHEIPQLTPEVARGVSYAEAEQLCRKQISPDETAQVEQLDQHLPWVGRIFFDATDLLFLRYLLVAHPDYADAVFSGTLIDYRDMMNSRFRIEQFSLTSGRYPNTTDKVLVPDANRVFTLKAEPVPQYPAYPARNSQPEERRPVTGVTQTTTSTAANGSGEPTAPAIFLGLPCPTYWEETNFMRRALVRIVPLTNGQWQSAAKQLTVAHMATLAKRGRLSISLSTPPSEESNLKKI